MNSAELASMLGIGKRDQGGVSLSWGKVESVSGDQVTANVIGTSVEAVKCCDCSAGDIVALEGQLGRWRAVGRKGGGESGGGGGTVEVEAITDSFIWAL